MVLEEEEDEDSRPAPETLETPAAISAATDAVNFVIVNTIGGDASAAPIVGDADESQNLSAEAGMDFAVVFETADSTMTWVDSLTYTGGSESFMSQ